MGTFRWPEAPLSFVSQFRQGPFPAMNIAFDVRSNASLPPSNAQPPLLRFLSEANARFRGDMSGALANYIPELTKADPHHFGIAVATIDGHVYEVGDSSALFTIQSVSKAFVFALALEMLGTDEVEEFVGVEPSG